MTILREEKAYLFLPRKQYSILCGSSFGKSDSEATDLQVLEKIIKLDLPSDYVFNVFYAFTTKYIPRETRQGSQIYDLFRLIVQYHDPQLKYATLCQFSYSGT